MTEINGDGFSVIIDGTDYSVYFDSFSESGGKPIITKKKAYNDNYYNVITGFEDWSITLNMRINNNSKELLDELITNYNDLHEIEVGSESVYTVIYNNMKANGTTSTVDASGEILTGSITFICPGTRTNRVQE